MRQDAGGKTGAWRGEAAGGSHGGRPQARTLSRVAWRFIPFLVLCYFVAYLDRVNVGFAKLTMDAQLGLSETAFGFGAGVFFLAYFLFEVPSNIILDKVGARRWIAASC